VTDKRAAVIGAGFGGLALAIRLQSAGVRTVLFEARDKPGGRAYVYEDAGFTFDAGPTVITDPSALEELWALSGRRLSDYVELLPVSPFYRLEWSDGYNFDYVNDQAELDRQIAAKSPADVEGYRRFLRYSEELLQEGYVKLGTTAFLNFSSMLRAAPQLTKLQAWRSVHSMVAEFIKDDHLRQAFSFHSLLVGGNPFATSSIYALIHALERKWGVWFPRGGTGALVQGMVRLFQDLGGELRLSTPVDRITTADGRVTGVALSDGATEAFDLVASNGDVVHTYDRLLREDARGVAAAKAVKKKRFSMSLFVIYFGLKRKHPDLQHHTVIFGPRYKELIGEIFKGPELAQDFSLYLHAPTRTDPSLAPDGCEAFYVLSPVPHLGGAIDWAEAGEAYRRTIERHLSATLLPGLEREVVTSRTLTPQDFQDRLLSFRGAAFGMEPVLTQSAWFRPHNRSEEVERLYLVGAGTHPGAGLPGVFSSARVLDTVVPDAASLLA
jgi:phytoene desaturase